jgi:ankyrin repeat protein
MVSTTSSPDNTIWSAAYVGDLAAVKAHIEQGGQGPDVKDPLQGSTALHWAAFGGHLGLVRWLVKDAGRLVGSAILYCVSYKPLTLQWVNSCSAYCRTGVAALVSSAASVQLR